ncbi:MAG: hypothetical protein AAF790_14090, partial [Planctomycetota bacterium]
MIRTAACLLAAAAAVAATPALAQFGPDGQVGPGESYHIAFATSFQTRMTTDRSVPPSGNIFGGIEAASWLTTLAAAQSGLLPDWNGQDILYRAVLSDSTGNAVDTTGIQGRVYNTAGQLLATDAADFFDGQLENPIGFDEFGNAVDPGQPAFWSGVRPGGSIAFDTCGNWDLTASDLGTNAGTATQTSWIFGPTIECVTNSARLLGISPAITA